MNRVTMSLRRTVLLPALFLVPAGLSAQLEDTAPASTAEQTSTEHPSIVPELEAAGDEKPLPPGFDPQFIGEEAAQLTVWNRPIIELRARVSGLEPAARVAQAVERITSLPLSLLEEKVWSEATEIRGMDFVLIGVQDQVILPLRREDLNPTSHQTLEELGAEAAARIQEVLAAQAEQRHWPTVLQGILLSLIATLIFVVLLWGIVRLRTRLALRLTQLLRSRKLHLSGFDLKPYLGNLVRGTVALFSWVLIVPAAYLWLTYVLKRFPFTRPWGDQLGHFLFELLAELSLGALVAIPGLFTVFLIFLFTRFLTRIVGAFFLSVESGALDVHWLQPETAKATRRLVIVVMWIFALTVAYPYIPGSNSAAFKGVSVFVGLMISLGATGLVNQIVSGMVIVYTRAFRPGEFVSIGDTEGTVEEIGVLSTKIATLRNEHITIPNAVLVGTAVNNFSRDAGREGAVISSTVTIGYDAPWRQVHALLKLAANRCEGIRKDPAPRVRQRNLSDFYAEYVLLVNIDDPAERYVILSDLNGHIQDAFNEHGVQILSPHFEAQPEQAVFVPKDKWVVPPAEPESD